MLRVSKDGKRSLKSLGISLNPNYWNFEKNEPKTECPNKVEIEQLILKTKIEYQQKLLQAKVSGEDFTSETLVKETKSKIRLKTVNEFYLELIESLKSNGYIGNSNVYKNSYNSLRSLNNENPQALVNMEILK